ncbi:hypothetical protein QCE49_20905 [Caballeronia sp. LZ008]|uniref:hypothetical protein n=1 Tax=unclassified Caballeronia TaxID=2646786 RepID=UPI002027F51E|nr:MULTISPECIES: hypothetical protein [unclassified Caballeronia]MDR5795840.1 hypothetical protein [Caballeronia sp. LZ008]
MKAKINPKFLAMMAACTVVSGIGVAHAQGMPADAQQLVQTMRPMYMSQAMPDESQTQTAATPQQASGGDSAYGGMKPASASGHRDSDCSPANCNVFFGQ